MSDKPGFMIQHKHMRSIIDMTDKELGEILRKLYQVSIGEDPEPPKKNRHVFNIMADEVREDARKYDEKVEKYRNNANKRWEEKNAMASNGMPSHAIASNGKQYINNTIQYKNINKNNNTALAYDQREDDLNDVLMEV